MSVNLNLLDEKGVYEAFHVDGNEAEALTDCYRRTISETEWQKYVQFYCPDGT